MLKNVIILSISCLAVLNLHAQDKFELTITFPPNFDVNNISVGYNDGVENKGFHLKFEKNKVIANGEYYSKYATIWVVDELEDVFEWREYWVAGNSEIRFTTTESNQLVIDSLVNAIDLRLLRKSKGFESNEYERYVNFFDQYLTLEFKGEFTDSLRVVRESLVSQWNKKEQQLVQQNITDYYSFDLFRRKLIYSSLNPDTLLQTFEKFPENFKKGEVGDTLKKYLKGKSLRNGSLSPFFSATDAFKKNKISNENGQNVLLVFWASWCKPCIKELPEVLTFINSYPKGELKPVFITIDNDFSKFEDAVKKYKLSSYNHVFGDKSLNTQFGINGVPEIYLISKNNQVVYKRSELGDNNLKNLLSLMPDQ